VAVRRFPRGERRRGLSLAENAAERQAVLLKQNAMPKQLARQTEIELELRAHVARSDPSSR
jgi:hypothetical protein